MVCTFSFLIHVPLFFFHLPGLLSSHCLILQHYYIPTVQTVHPRPDEGELLIEADYSYTFQGQKDEESQNLIVIITVTKFIVFILYSLFLYVYCKK